MVLQLDLVPNDIMVALPSLRVVVQLVLTKDLAVLRIVALPFVRRETAFNETHVSGSIVNL